MNNTANRTKCQITIRHKHKQASKQPTPNNNKPSNRSNNMEEKEMNTQNLINVTDNVQREVEKKLNIQDDE